MSKHVYSTFLIALTLVVSAVAQKGTSSLAGTVTDIRKQVIPGSSVMLTVEASGDQRTATTNGQGGFAFSSSGPFYDHNRVGQAATSNLSGSF